MPKLVCMPICISESDHSDLSIFPTIQLSSYLTCPTITTVQLCNHSDFLTVQPFQLTFHPFHLSDFLTIQPFQLSNHSNFPPIPTFQPIRLFNFPSIQLSNHSDCPTILTFQPI